MIVVFPMDFGPYEERVLGLSEEVLNTILGDVANVARDRWIQLAGGVLHSTRMDYIAGIQEVEIEPRRATVSLVGALPNGIENGMPAFDMHDTLLGPNVPTVPVGQRGKHALKNGKGFYRVIPFRHANPSAGYVVGVPMGAPYTKSLGPDVARSIGRAVYAIVSKRPSAKGPGFRPTVSTFGPGGARATTAYGDRLQAGIAPILRPTADTVSIGGVMRTRAPHSTDIYAGMIRKQKTYEKATQSSYNTFRTISSNQPDKFLHPGIEAKHLAQEISAQLGPIADATIRAFFEESFR